MILNYLEPLRKLFVSQLHENINNPKKVIDWEKCKEENTPMIARSFLKLCRHKHLIPHLFNIEQLQDYIQQTLPAITNGEQEFYDKNVLITAWGHE